MPPTARLGAECSTQPLVWQVFIAPVPAWAVVGLLEVADYEHGAGVCCLVHFPVSPSNVALNI